MIEVDRSQLLNAVYNPRQISEDARQRLKKAIAKVGLVAPIVWNKNTGNIVGGHQRLSVLDTLEGSAKYTLTVAMVDVPLAKEKEINVLLNNPEAQGDWDLGKLKEILSAEALDFESTGFDLADIYKLFGHDADETINAGVEKLAEQITAARDRFQQMTDVALNTNYSTEFYLVVLFRDNAERYEFTERFGLEDNRYQDGRKIAEMMKPPIRKASAEKPAPPPKKRAANTSTEVPAQQSQSDSDTTARSAADDS